MQPSSPVSLSWESKGRDALPPRVKLLGPEGWDRPATLIHGDNWGSMNALRGPLEGALALVYCDPPFFTGRQHLAVTRRREGGEIVRESRPAFDDRWDGLGDYLEALRTRLAVARDLLAPDGSLVVHVDPKTSHYIKVVCDELFGPASFASEIVWRYRRWPAKTPNFQRMHDVLLRYVKDPTVRPRFQQLYEPLAASTQATWGDKKQKAVVDAKGRRRKSSTTDDPSPGTPLGDVWEIGIVAPVARERTGYPTQKPLALLERVIGALTNPGDLVLDPYCGSGTTLAACQRLGRRAIGIDSNTEALAIARQRLLDLGVEPIEQRAVEAKLARRLAG